MEGIHEKLVAAVDGYLTALLADTGVEMTASDRDWYMTAVRGNLQAAVDSVRTPVLSRLESRERERLNALYPR